MYDFDQKPQFCYYNKQIGLSMKCALKWVESTDEFIHTIWWWPLLVTDCICTSLMACRRHLMSSVGQRVNEEKNAAKKPADALAKALRSSAFWKLGISITWISRLNEELNINVMYNIFTGRNVHLSLSCKCSNITNYNILLYKSQQDAHVTEFILQLLYMFWALLSPIFRSTNNCNYSIW